VSDRVVSLGHAAGGRPVAAARPVGNEIVDLLATLVEFNTESQRSNLGLIEYVRDYLRRHGVVSQLFFNEERNKANLYAVIGPPGRSGIAVSGHTDVVPVTGQDWSTDPWSLSERDGRLYGRGSCDMKGFIAVALAAVPRMTTMELQRPVQLCLSYDEEVGCVGVRSLLAYLSENANKPYACIVGEPTGMEVVIAHKGKLSVRCEVKGHACHSSLAPTGVNAIETAARVINKLREMGEDKQLNGPHDSAFDVSHTTIQTGVIHGGSAVNIVPDRCAFDFECRNVPDDDPERVLSEVRDFAEKELAPGMRARARDSDFQWTGLAEFPGLNTPGDAPIVASALQWAGTNELRKVAFGSEAGLFQRIGVATVLCGPGSIEQAHRPDEYVTLEQLARCERFMNRMLAELA